MDAIYLQKEVGQELAKGLAAVTAAQPYDPIDYLAKWLLQYIHNQDQDKQRDKQAIQLEEEKKKHAESLEWERMRKEQEEKEKKEAIRAAELAKEQAQLDLVNEFENKVSKREEATAQQQDQLVRPLNNLKERLQVIVNELESNAIKVNELFKVRGITSGDHPLANLLKATIVLVGWSQLSELTDWGESKKLLRNPDLLVEIKKYSPLKRQTINKFTSAYHLVKDYPLEEAKRTNYIIYLIWQWVMTNVNIRKAALVVKSERLNIPLINDPSSEFSNDNGDDEEEDLEEELHRSELLVKEAEAKERQKQAAAEKKEKEEEEENEEEGEKDDEAEGDEDDDEEDGEENGEDD